MYCSLFSCPAAFSAHPWAACMLRILAAVARKRTRAPVTPTWDAGDEREIVFVSSPSGKNASLRARVCVNITHLAVIATRRSGGMSASHTVRAVWWWRGSLVQSVIGQLSRQGCAFERPLIPLCPVCGACVLYGHIALDALPGALCVIVLSRVLHALICVCVCVCKER